MEDVEGGCNRGTNNLLKEQGSSANLHHDQKTSGNALKKKKNIKQETHRTMEPEHGRGILEQLPEMGTDTKPMQHGP